MCRPTSFRQDSVQHGIFSLVAPSEMKRTKMLKADVWFVVVEFSTHLLAFSGSQLPLHVTAFIQLYLRGISCILWIGWRKCRARYSLLERVLLTGKIHIVYSVRSTYCITGDFKMVIVLFSFVSPQYSSLCCSTKSGYSVRTLNYLIV